MAFKTIKKLGDKSILSITSGGTPSRRNLEYYKGNILWLKSGELNDSQHINNSEEKISEKALKNSSAKIFPKNTVLFAMYGATAGKLGILDVPAATNQAVAGMVCNEKVLHYKYLFYSLLNIREKIVDKAWGGAQPNLSQTIIKNFEIPLPPLSIQKKIVERIERLMGKIDEAKKLRKEAMADAAALIPSALHKIFEEGKKKGWEEKSLGEICDIARGGSPRPIKNYLTEAEDGINWIKIADATNSTKYIYKTKEKINKEGMKKTRIVKPGDLILTNSMSFGRPYIMKTTGAIHDGWLLLRPRKNILEEYMYYFLSSDEIYNQFSFLAGGAVVQNLNSELVKGVKILIPPFSDQQKIVKYLDSLFEKIGKVRAMQEQTNKELKELEKSVLRGVFVL